MNNSLFSFSFILLLKDKNSHLFSAFIFIFIIFILSSILFISQSIKNDLVNSINYQPQIVVENQKAGRHIQITEDTWDELLQITGIKKITPQIDGYYYFAQNDSYFHIIGLDDHSEDSITIGHGIKKVFNK
jgi:putative ABC transport system permease protein